MADLQQLDLFGGSKALAPASAPVRADLRSYARMGGPIFIGQTGMAIISKLRSGSELNQIVREEFGAMKMDPSNPKYRQAVIRITELERAWDYPDLWEVQD